MLKENYCRFCGYRILPNEPKCNNCGCKTKYKTNDDNYVFTPPIYNIGFFDLDIDFSPYLENGDDFKYNVCSCGYLNEIDDEFCYMCGAKKSKRRISKLIKNNKNSLFLDNILCVCGNINSKDSIYCEFCGTKLKKSSSKSFNIYNNFDFEFENPIFCFCGEENDSDAQWCRNCGRPLANNEKIRELNRQLEEKRKQQEKERRAKLKHEKILQGLRNTMQEELVVNSEWAEELENVYNINGYYQKNKNVTLIGGPIGQMALILNYVDEENPEFSAESKIDKILDAYLEKSHPINFLWSKEDLEKIKGINENIESIEDIVKASDEEYKTIIDNLYNNSFINDDMLQIFFDVCETMQLTEVKDLYIKIFNNILQRFKTGNDYGQVRFLEINKESYEEIPLLCICLITQESIPLENPMPEQNRNKMRKKLSFESYFYERTSIMPSISDKIKIISINKNFDKNYRNNFLECLDFLFTLEPEKQQYIDNLNEKNENFIKCLLIKLGEKYKKEIVDMSINLPKEGEEEDGGDDKEKDKEEK